jgi:hypothetical protein
VGRGNPPHPLGGNVKVKLLCGMSGPDYIFVKGDIVDLPDKVARKLVENEMAVEESRKATLEPEERATKKPQR